MTLKNIEKPQMSETNDLLTIRDILRWAVSRFNASDLYYGHGTDCAWDEAIALILHTLHLSHDINPQILDARLTRTEREKLLAIIERRATERMPLPYLINEAWFAGLPFYVDERVLIPRSPLAELIEHQFMPWVDSDSVHEILDLCTGSGCIAIACAKAFPESHVDASDISPEALAVAKINCERHAVTDQVTLFQSNLFQSLPTKKYDIIVSNPPYVDEEDMQSLPAEYHHEPTLGLASGTDGLDATLIILQQANNYLNENGVLIVEVGNSEYALAEKFPEVPFTWLEFERGGGGVFLLTAKELVEYQRYFLK